MSRIPVKAAKQVAEEHNLSQVILLGWDGKTTHIVTYGKTVEDCDMAAQGANYLKSLWNWPESTLVDPHRVEKLKVRIEELEREIQAIHEDAAGIDI
jgi:hypothetical protein